MKQLGISIALLFFTFSTWAATYPMPAPGSDIIGRNFKVSARSGDTLSSIGRRYGVGYYEMAYANRKLHHSNRLRRGTRVLIPGQFILPAGPREGIVVNLAELRLYYFPKGENIVMTYPVGIGREGGWDTPVGQTRVVAKKEDPVWRPTQRVRADAASKGYPIPKVFPPGPDNPLGRHMLRLGWPTFLIHGTNQVQSIGGRVSAGCIRMLPAAIEDLYYNVPVGTKVTVINEPFKAGWHYGKLYFEAHRPLKEEAHKYRWDKSAAVAKVREKLQHRRKYIKWSKVRKAINKQSGIPQLVSR